MTKNKQLTEKEVKETLDYSAEVYRALKINPSMIFNSFSNAQTQNEVLVSLNNKEIKIDSDLINKALADTINNEDVLQSVSGYLKTVDGIYASTINYLANLLSFDVYRYCINANGQDYASEEYQQDLARAEKILKNFDAKREFRKVLYNCLLYDTYYCFLRGTNNMVDDDEIVSTKTQKYALQMMPQDKCILSGYNENGYLYDLDFSYFQQQSASILDFDASIIELYNEWIKQNGKDTNNKFGSNSAFFKQFSVGSYVRLPQEKGAWVFKFNDDNFKAIPPLSHMLSDCFDNDTVRKLALDKNIQSAHAMIVGSIPLHKGDNSATQKQAFKIKGNDLVTFINLMRKGLSKNIVPIASPLEDNKLMEFKDTNTNMQSDQFKNSSGLGVAMNRAVYSNNDLSAEETLYLAEIDYNFVKQMYPQFSKFLTYFVNKKTKKFKFEVVVDGANITHIRSKNIEYFTKLANLGVQCSLNKWSATLGLKYGELEAMMDEFIYTGSQDKLIPLLDAHTSSNGSLSQTNGRPSIEQTEANNLNGVGSGVDD